MNQPLVSIIIPFYNSEKYLKETIESAINQSWPHKEIVLVNDGSTDGSLIIAKNYESKEIKILSQINKGASAARNFGLREAKGDFIQFLDADDLLSPNKIEEQIVLVKNFKKKITFCQLYDLNDNKIIKKESKNINNLLLYTPKEFLPNYLGLTNQILHLGIHAWLIPKQLITENNYWNENLSLDDDGEFILRIILKAEDGICFSEKGSCYYRKHETKNNSSSQTSYLSFKSAIKSHDLKYNALITSNFLKIKDLNKRFADGYKWLSICCYPKYIDLYKYSLKRSELLGGSKFKVQQKLFSKKIIQFLFGWKTLRIVEEVVNKLK